MKIKIFLTTAFLVVVNVMVFSQTITHPWRVIDQGGGRSTAGDVTLQASIGQPAVQKMTYIDTGMVLESGYIPGLRDLSGSTLSMPIPVEANWNMVSVPLLLNDYLKALLFPTAVSSAFRYSAGYQISDTLKTGSGYWLKFPAAGSLTMSGTGLTVDTILVQDKWNMVGSLSYPLLTSGVVPVPPVTITSAFYGFSNSTGYIASDTLKPGSAYWLKVNGSGKLVMQTGSLLVMKASTLAAVSKTKSISSNSGRGALSRGTELSSIVFRDAEGKERAVHFSETQIDIDLNKFELPPPPPLGIFDVRYESQRSLVVVDPKNQNEAPLLISSAKYPVTVIWENNDNAKASLVIDGKVVNLDNNGTALISKPAVSIHLKLSPVVPAEVPKKFALHQNYPNPFNPGTTIRYDLPDEAKIRVRIYNVLGQVVATLMDEVQSAGYKKIEWNSSGFKGHSAASGLYFYGIEATSTADPGKAFSQVKKMILLK